MIEKLLSVQDTIGLSVLLSCIFIFLIKYWQKKYWEVKKK